jgi:hypothetical protein
MVFGFGRRKREELARRRDHARRELQAQAEALRTELELLNEKLNVGMKQPDGDRTTTLSRYPRRIVELKIQIDEIERKLVLLGDR